MGEEGRVGTRLVQCSGLRAELQGSHDDVQDFVSPQMASMVPEMQLPFCMVVALRRRTEKFHIKPHDDHPAFIQEPVSPHFPATFH